MGKSEPDHDRDHDGTTDDGHANDNRRASHANDNRRAVAPASAEGALAALNALKASFANVDTSAVAGRSGLPLMLFKREGDGTYLIGQKRMVPESGSRWAANVRTFQWGYVAFGAANKKLGEHMVPVSKPLPDVTQLPDLGAKWQEQWSVNMKCIDGTDAGTEVTFKASTDGGTKAIVSLFDAVKNRLESGQHDGNVVPIFLLDKNSYQHPEFGRVWFPVLTIVDFMPLDGPAPAPKPTAPSPEQQPRRRTRVA